MLNLFAIPETGDYMIAGYVVLTLALVAYLTSLVVRWRKAAAEYRSYQDDRLEK
jgi:hypothetical protein